MNDGGMSIQGYSAIKAWQRKTRDGPIHLILFMVPRQEGAPQVHFFLFE